ERPREPTSLALPFVEVAADDYACARFPADPSQCNLGACSGGTCESLSNQCIGGGNQPHVSVDYDPTIGACTCYFHCDLFCRIGVGCPPPDALCSGATDCMGLPCQCNSCWAGVGCPDPSYLCVGNTDCQGGLCPCTLPCTGACYPLCGQDDGCGNPCSNADDVCYGCGYNACGNYCGDCGGGGGGGGCGYDQCGADEDCCNGICEEGWCAGG